MRESQKQKLDSLLHQTILSRIIIIQRWYRAKHQRRSFILIRSAVIKIQAQVRCWLAQQLLNHLRMEHQAATCIQRIWRGYKVRSWYNFIRNTFIKLQARIRGKQSRVRFQAILEKRSYKQITQRASINKEEEEKSHTTALVTVKEISPIITELPQVRNIVVETPSKENQQLPPPRRRPAASQKKTPPPLEHLVNIDSRAQENEIKRRSSSDRTTQSHVEISRRLSETAVMQTRRQSQGLSFTPLQNRRSEELHGSYVSPPASPGALRQDKSEIDGTRPPLKTKSFRHRQYQKVPDGIDSQMEQEKQTDSLTTADDDRSGPSSIKFPKIKKRLQSFIGKREGSISESDDNSCESSGPHTPTSIIDPSFSSQEASYPTSTIGNQQTHKNFSVDYKPSRRDSKTKEVKPIIVTGDHDSEVTQITHSKESSTFPFETPASFSSSMATIHAKGHDDLKKFLSTTHHNLKQSQLRKGELCSSCDKPFTKFFVNQGYKCTSCKKLFHSGCVKSSLSVPCLYADNTQFLSVGKENTSPSLKKNRRLDEKNWNVTRTSQFIDRSDEVIKDVNELKALEEFITQKIYKLEDSVEDRGDCNREHSLSQDLDHGALQLRERKDSQVDQLFCSSLKAFKGYLVSAYSISSQKSTTEVAVVLKYKDLIKNFEQEMNTVCLESTADATFPVTMGVNAFRGFLDEFIRDKSKRMDDKLTVKKRKRPRRKKTKKIEEIPFGMHSFVHIYVNIYTQCEVCNSILWLSTKALSCQKCKVTCHQKCLSKVEPNCTQNASTKAVVVGLDSSRKGPSSNHKNSRPRPVPIGKVFGVPLENLVSPEEKIPGVVDRLLSSVELYGIYTEGLYRKSGASLKVREIKGKIDKNPEEVTFEDTPIHVLTSILKSYLRELPEPLLTYDAYDPLLHASALEDTGDMFQITLNVIHRLPKPNFDLLERLIFHLARVAQYEKYNRMNCNSLAIVFSPCILRSPRSVPVQDSLNDISKQTLVIELLISRQLSKTCDLLRDIENVDNASMSAGAKLSSLRASKMRATHTLSAGATSSGENVQGLLGSTARLDPREALAAYKLEEQLEEFQDTKCRLTLGLTELVRGSSEEDLLSTDMSHAGSMEDITFSGSSIRSVTSTPSLLYDDVDGSQDFHSRRRERRSTKFSSETEEDKSVTSSSLHQEYGEDAVMV